MNFKIPTFDFNKIIDFTTMFFLLLFFIEMNIILTQNWEWYLLFVFYTMVAETIVACSIWYLFDLCFLNTIETS